MKPYILSPQAFHDLTELLSYIRRDSPQNATLVESRLTELFRRLGDPVSPGHRSEFLRDQSLQVATASRYQVVYDPEADPIVVVRILRGGRDLRRI